MNKNREAFIDRMNQCMNRLLHASLYSCTKAWGQGITACFLYYVLNDGKAHSQKKSAEEWLVPRTTLTRL